MERRGGQDTVSFGKGPFAKPSSIWLAIDAQLALGTPALSRSIPRSKAMGIQALAAEYPPCGSDIRLAERGNVSGCFCTSADWGGLYC